MSIPLPSALKKINFSNTNHIFIGVLILTLILGITAGRLLSGTSQGVTIQNTVNQTPNSAAQDSRTFNNFAEGMIQKRPASKNPNEYVEGTHFLIRAGAVPVALTSSVVDLSEYEGKKVKVFGETQKALKEGWLMDVGKVEMVQ